MKLYESIVLSLICFIALFMIACTGSIAHSDGPVDSDTAVGTGTDSASDGDTDSNDTSMMLPADDEALLLDITKAFTESRQMTPAELVAQYPAQTNTSLDYAPLDAQNLSLIQASNFALNETELSLLQQNGFAISRRMKQTSFFSGYSEIYRADLPVYISADAILDSLHRSFDSILKHLEEQRLYPDLDELLQNLRDELQADSQLSNDIKADVDMYLTVAQSLLKGEQQPVMFADENTVTTLYVAAEAAMGMHGVNIFGKFRQIDFSQFTPRGHYTESAQLKAYFKAMLWLGRIDFRMVETLPDGFQVVNRAELKGALALGHLTRNHLERWSRINQTIQLFVGESDNMTPQQTDDLMTALGISEIADLEALDDDRIKAVILQNGFGSQRINSHLMSNGLTAGTLPLNASFLLLGQRFIVDSYVFSNLVYDRVQGGTVHRLMPSPLDVGFAVMNNNQAASLLLPELAQYPYAPDLHMMRTVVGTYTEDFWRANLYNGWLHSLSELSLSAGEGMPSYTQTAQWEKRMLNTQLASWAELRHDTILYAKQSYTDGFTCQFPDAYVEPYPAFFEKLVTYADIGLEVMTTLADAQPGALLTQAQDYFTELAFACEILGEMATQQLNGTPHTAAQLAFINEAIRIDLVSDGCTSKEVPEGWYKRLFFEPDSALEFDPTIADVHTQPEDESGMTVGKVLHVATGYPRAMVVTVNQCDGPRAYMGMVFSYHEKVTDDFYRMNDEEWSSEVGYEAYPDWAPDDYVPPADVQWMMPLVAQ